MNFTRDTSGTVISQSDCDVVTATVPHTRSALGIIATNGLIHNGVYKEDGWVYLDDVPVRKWHISFNQIRIWEPKFKDIISLHRLWKRTQSELKDNWNRTISVIEQFWRGKGTAVAHAKPVHHLEFPGNKSYWGDKDIWWEFEVSDYYGKGPTLGWQWLEERPKKLKNPKQGALLYQLDIRHDSLGKRAWKARVIFFEAMRRALPKPTEHAIFTYKFGEDCFIFHTVQTGHCWGWTMFDDRYKLEVKEMV